MCVLSVCVFVCVLSVCVFVCVLSVCVFVCVLSVCVFVCELTVISPPFPPPTHTLAYVYAIGGFLATLVPIINALFRLYEGSIMIYGRRISGNAGGVELAFFF